MIYAALAVAASSGQAIYARAFRWIVSAVRALRPHHWPLVGGLIGRVADRVMGLAHPAVVTAAGHEFRLDPSDDLGLARGRAHEPLLCEVIERHVQPGATMVDGGAHIGYFTLLGARLVGPSGRVIAFEPAPDTYTLLAENVARNGYANITLVQAGLADRSSSGVLQLNEEHPSDHRIGGAAGRDAIEIELHSLDDFLGDNGRVDFIKLDVQGAEPLVLRGARTLLERNPRLIAAIEYAPYVLPDDVAPEEFLQELFSRFSKVFDVNEDSKSVVPATPGDLLAAYTRENERFTNLLCMN